MLTRKTSEFNKLECRHLPQESREVQTLVQKHYKVRVSMKHGPENPKKIAQKNNIELQWLETSLKRAH